MTHIQFEWTFFILNLLCVAQKLPLMAKGDKLTKWTLLMSLNFFAMCVCGWRLINLY